MGCSSLSPAPAAVVEHAAGHVSRGTLAAGGYLCPAGAVQAADCVHVAGPVPELQSGGAAARPQRIESSGIAVTSVAGAHSVPHAVQPVWTAESGAGDEQARPRVSTG